MAQSCQDDFLMQVVDGYGADSSICVLPVFLGGAVSEADICGAGTTVEVAAPDASGGVAAHVTVFRQTDGRMMISVVMTCDWLMVASQDDGWGVSGTVSYGYSQLAFQGRAPTLERQEESSLFVTSSTHPLACLVTHPPLASQVLLLHLAGSTDGPQEQLPELGSEHIHLVQRAEIPGP